MSHPGVAAALIQKFVVKSRHGDPLSYLDEYQIAAETADGVDCAIGDILAWISIPVRDVAARRP